MTAVETPANGPPRVVTSTSLGVRGAAIGLLFADETEREVVLVEVRFTLLRGSFSRRPRTAPNQGR